MLLVNPTATVKPTLPDSLDSEPPERTAARIIEFEDFRRQTADDKNLNDIIYFPIIVADSLSAEAQNIVKRFCGDSVSSLKVEPLLRKHQSKIWISIKSAAYGLAVHALIIGLPSAEFGTVTHISAALNG